MYAFADSLNSLCSRALLTGALAKGIERRVVSWDSWANSTPLNYETSRTFQIFFADIAAENLVIFYLLTRSDSFAIRFLFRFFSMDLLFFLPVDGFPSFGNIYAVKAESRQTIYQAVKIMVQNSIFFARVVISLWQNQRRIAKFVQEVVF